MKKWDRIIIKKWKYDPTDGGFVEFGEDNIVQLFIDYFAVDNYHKIPVRIKCKKGKILIERLKKKVEPQEDEG